MSAARGRGKIRTSRGARLSVSGESAGQSPSEQAPHPGPVRTCVGCRVRASRAVLLRVVAVEADGDMAVTPDPHHRLAGRGAWLHPDPSCLDLAERRRAFPRALRREGPLDTRPVREAVTAGRIPSSRPTVPHGSGSEADEHPMSTQR